jgi:dTDP-4-amino-4,6-dideoxy-D-galactose acyltransferase
MKIKVCEWDSLFFNKKVGEIEFDNINQSFEELTQFDLIYSKQKQEAIFEINDFEHTYTETKVIFSKNINKSNNPVNSAISSVLNTDINKDQIYKLAFESGKFSRFKLDNKFEQDEFEKLYKIWIDNSLANKIADDVLIYKQGDTVLGLITYKISDHYATIGLLATDPEIQGKGIGTILVKAVEDRLANAMISELRIPTQLQNEKACSFYTKLGYTIKEKIIIKHYWRK